MIYEVILRKSFINYDDYIDEMERPILFTVDKVKADALVEKWKNLEGPYMRKEPMSMWGERFDESNYVDIYIKEIEEDKELLILDEEKKFIEGDDHFGYKKLPHFSYDSWLIRAEEWEGCSLTEEEKEIKNNEDYKNLLKIFGEEE